MLMNDFRNYRYSEIKLTKKESAGILSKRIVSTGLSHLAQVPGQNKFAFTKLQLTSKVSSLA